MPNDAANPPRVRVFNDDDVSTALTPQLAVDAARRALVDAYHGLLASPPRIHADVGDISLAFTVGGYPDGPLGFRVYGTWPGDSDQAVLVWDSNGHLEGVVAGWELGARRTGALGAAAAAALARPAASRVAVVGSGRQAWAQIWALTGAIAPREVHVFSPTVEHRRAFAQRLERELGVTGHVARSAEEAVTGADVVVLATRAQSPVIAVEWLDSGTHVTTVGPKLANACETPPALADRAAVITSDSPEQAAAYGRPFFTQRPLTHVGAVISGEHPGRQSDDEITLHCSTGLAGSEVVIAAEMLRAGSRARPGRTSRRRSSASAETEADAWCRRWS